MIATAAFIGLVALVSLMTWVLVAALPVEEAFAPAYRVQRQITAVGLAFALLFAPLVWLATRRGLDPLLALRDAIQRIRADPGAAARVPVTRQDEIGDLATEFNALVAERQRAERALRESEQRLRTSEALLQQQGAQLSLALEGSQLALFDWNIATGAVYLSEHWAVIMGRPA